jgi:hypothetical protein
MMALSLAMLVLLVLALASELVLLEMGRELCSSAAVGAGWLAASVAHENMGEDDKARKQHESGDVKGGLSEVADVILVAGAVVVRSGHSARIAGEKEETDASESDETEPRVADDKRRVVAGTYDGGAGSLAVAAAMRSR